MKFTNVSKGLLLGLALLLATSVFAANNNNKGSLAIGVPVNVSGTSLSAGDYSVRWEGTGSNVQLSILKGNKVVATTPAHLIDLNTKAADDTAVLKTNGDGSKSLAEVRFGGKKYALAIGDESASSDAGGSSK